MHGVHRTADDHDDLGVTAVHTMEFVGDHHEFVGDSSVAPTVT